MNLLTVSCVRLRVGEGPPAASFRFICDEPFLTCACYRGVYEIGGGLDVFSGNSNAWHICCEPYLCNLVLRCGEPGPELEHL